MKIKIRMKYFVKTIFHLALMWSLFILNAQASTFLLSGLADPDGVVVPGTSVFAKNNKDTLIFSGTGAIDRLNIYRATMSSITSGTPDTSFYRAFIPKDVVNAVYPGQKHNYCYVFSPDFSLESDNSIKIYFTAVFKEVNPSNLDEDCGDIDIDVRVPAIFETTMSCTNSSQCTQPSMFSPPNYVNFSHVSVFSPSPYNYTMTSQYMRIDPAIFVDGSNTWFSYTWWDGAGNQISTLNTSSNVLYHHSRINGLYDEHINESPEIFKRGSYYYLLFSQNHYHSNYQISYKKGLSLLDLSTVEEKSNAVPISATSNNELRDCRLTFNSWETKSATNPKPAAHEIDTNGYNAGHGGVFEYNGNYYLIYHYGAGRFVKRYDNTHSPLYSFYRSTYVDKLEFENNGNIKQIAAPFFVDNGNAHIDNHSWCYD